MNDQEMARLLGEAPPSPDPRFRFDVFARIAAVRRRRAVLMRGAKLVGVTAALGLSVPLLRILEIDLRPLLLIAGVLGLAYVLALLAMGGPRGALVRSTAMLRARI